MTGTAEYVDDFIGFVSDSPSSYHAAAAVAERLVDAGFVVQKETEAWDASPGGHVVIRDGAVIAWWIPADATPLTAYRVLGAHTDSPTFKLKPNPDTGAAGWAQVGVEVYGGPLLNSWLDRDLGLAGRLCTVDGTEYLVRTGAVMRIPQLAIHLDRQVNSSGLQLDPQRHTQPIWSANGAPGVLEQLASLAGVAAADIAGYDILAFDTQTPSLIGVTGEFLASPRLDNLSSVYAGLTALERASSTDTDAILVLAAFDHEELGSESRSGACGPFLEDVLRRTTATLGGSADDCARALAASFCVSADAGHAVHPNYPERHDPANQPLAGGGPLLKINANQRYTTDAPGAARWVRACRAAGVPIQPFVSNNSVPCGSTIGPLTATRLGIATVDVGVPLLSMHSARELCAVADLEALSRAIEAFYRAD